MEEEKGTLEPDVNGEPLGEVVCSTLQISVVQRRITKKNH